MPLYEYKCRDCEHIFELRQAWKDPMPDCPECGGEVKKVLHAAALVFKGSGWHVNDYGKSGPNKAKSTNGSGEAGEKAAEKVAGKASTSAGSTNGSSSTKSETTTASGGSKPEAKTGT